MIKGYFLVTERHTGKIVDVLELLTLEETEQNKETLALVEMV